MSQAIATPADVAALVNRIVELEDALKHIIAIGGNLPDERLTDRTGPNDAAHRGMMYCHAREIAIKARKGVA